MSTNSSSTLVDTARRSLRRHMVAGIAVLVIFVGGVGGWAAVTDIAGAVVAGGMLVVDSNIKKVQHQTGGIVSALLVQEGQKVEAGAILVRLDDTQARANLGIVEGNLAEFLARQARLEAEREDSIALDFAALRKLDLPDTERLVGAEQKLFDLRRTARLGKRQQLNERIGQLHDEIRGLTGQIAAKDQELKFIRTELAGVRELWEKKLVPIQRMTALERDATRIDGERNVLSASVAQSKGKITETELQILQIEQDLRGDVARELREVQAKIAELQERRIAAADMLRKIDLRAPISGYVHQLAVHTVGGVITPAEALMLIVPHADPLVVEARIPPQSIDQVHAGQEAILRFSAFNQRVTPEIKGEVDLVAADITVEPKSSATYYTVRVRVDPAELARLGALKIVPGMPVEVFVQTGERTALSYLAKPLTDQVARMFRER